MHVVTAALVLAQETGGESQNPILPSFNELIVGIIAFAVLFFLLWRVALPRASQTLRERTENIEGKLEHAERERQQAEELLRRYRERLAKAHDDSQRIIDEARANAERLRRDLMSKAEQQAERVINQGRQAIRAERDRAVRELRGEVGTLAVELATRVIGDSLDRERQLRLIDSYIEQLGEHSVAGAPSSREDGSGAAQ
ncbi:MAG TPA: F0F1 ATP synthase subunit B [Actinomycetes bacterium]|nr:F0F1 ATP synthase subunit B [Actinomycetes bacterium]